MRLLCTEHGQQATRQYTYGSLNNSEEIGALHFYNIDTTRKCTKDIKRVKKLLKYYNLVLKVFFTSTPGLQNSLEKIFVTECPNILLGLYLLANTFFF